jgi:hypothetical protein
MLDISLLQYLRRQAEMAWPGLSTEQRLDQLRKTQKYNLLYPPQGERSPNRVATGMESMFLGSGRLTGGSNPKMALSRNTSGTTT